MRPAFVVACALVAGVGGGFASRLVPEAHAAVATMVVPVPSGGLVFRGVAGNALVRVREDASGGVLEVFDASEHVAVRLRASASSGGLELETVRTRPQAALPGSRLDDPGY